jgi:hypothetical protein
MNLTRSLNVAKSQIHRKGMGTLLPAGLMLLIPYSEYRAARAEGRGLLYSAGKGVVLGGAFAVAPFATSAMLFGAPLLRSATAAGVSFAYSGPESMRARFRPFSSELRDTPVARQERNLTTQEAVASFTRARSILGREATAVHRRYG